MTQGLELRGAVLGKGYRLGRRLDDHDETAYEGTHERIPGRFVIRLFPPDTLLQPESSSRIQRGARVASLLRDPHAVQILDCNASGETPAFVVMERPAGPSLATLMADTGMLPLGRVVDLIDSIAAALAAGHQIGLVHGDLRPAHVVLPAAGQPIAKLAGFGWAKELRAAAVVPAPSGYLAPEQHFGKVLALDERVDQFALAALAYEMIAACLPFSEESADMAELLGTPRTPPAIADLVPGIPKTLDEVLRRGLAFAPSDRFPSVLELASKLRTAAALESPATERTQVMPIPNFAAVSPGPGAAPAKPSSDVTEELDLATLSPLHTEDDIEFDSSADDDRDEAKDDAKLVLGPVSRSTVSDDAKTQIRRSPFFEGDSDADADPSEEDSVAGPPKRGLPVGRPAKTPEMHGNRSPGRAVALTPAETISTEWGPSASLADRLSAIWAEVHKRRAWVFPAATGVALLLIVGAMVVMSGDPDDDALDVTAATPALQAPQSAPAPQGTAATPPTAAAPTAAAPPATAVMPSVPAPPGAPISPVRAPAPRLGTQVGAGPARVESPGSPLSIAGDRGGVPPGARTNRPMARRAPPKTDPAMDPEGEGAPSSPPASASLGGGPDDCSIRITSRPWAQVWIDGKNTGRKTPIDNLKVACGTRKLELKRPDKDIEQMEMLQVEPGSPYRGDYELQ